MRVTQNLNQLNFITAMTTLEANLSQTQNQIATNLSFTTPSQNPVAAGAVNNYTKALSQTQPFALSATGATYSGDQGQRQVQIAAGQTIPDSDNGAAVFNSIKTGNGTFTAAAGAGNTGGGVLGVTTVTNPA